MSKINKFFCALIGGLWLALAPEVALAGYTEIDCPATGDCPTGYTRAEGVDDGWIWDSKFCVCWKCDGEVEDCEAQHGIMKGCIPLQVKLREAKSCLFCPLFQSLYQAVQTISRQAFDATKDPIRIVMSLAFAIAIAFSVLGHVSSLTKQDAPKFITGLLGNSFKFLVAFLLLMNKDTIYYYVINPLLSTALDFGGAMLFTAGQSLNECKTNTAGLGTSADKVLPNELYATMECFIKGVQAEIAFAQAAGSSIMCVGRNEASGAFGIWDFSMVFSGLAIYLCALLLTLAFGFYLIDSVVMLGVLGALMTFFIACWPFKMTGGYTSKGFNMFMNIFFTFIFMGVVVSINTQLIKASLATGGLENLEDALSGGNISDSKQILDINGAGFLIILCCCFFGFKFSGKTAQLAGSMAGGGGIDIGAKLGGLATSGAVNSATKVGKAAAAPVMAKAKQAGNAALDTAANFVAHPFKSTRKLAGVVTKRFGQTQKATGAAQGIAGNLAMAAGMQKGADWVKQGENLYNKGQANTERGQARIDKENAGIYGGGNDASSQAQNSTPATNDSNTAAENSNTNTNSGSENTNSGAENANPNANTENTNAETNSQTSTSSNNTKANSYADATANNQRGGSSNARGNAYDGTHKKYAHEEAQEKYDEQFQNQQPSSAEECDKLAQREANEYQSSIDSYQQNLDNMAQAINERNQAMQDMAIAQAKINSATTLEQKNAAHAEYSQAEGKYQLADAQAKDFRSRADRAQRSSYVHAMAHEKYKYAANSMRDESTVNWDMAHEHGMDSLLNITRGFANGGVENAGPRSQE